MSGRSKSFLAAAAIILCACAFFLFNGRNAPQPAGEPAEEGRVRIVSGRVLGDVLEDGEVDIDGRRFFMDRAAIDGLSDDSIGELEFADLRFDGFMAKSLILRDVECDIDAAAADLGQGLLPLSVKVGHFSGSGMNVGGLAFQKFMGRLDGAWGTIESEGFASPFLKAERLAVHHLSPKQFVSLLRGKDVLEAIGSIDGFRLEAAGTSGMIAAKSISISKDREYVRIEASGLSPAWALMHLIGFRWMPRDPSIELAIEGWLRAGRDGIEFDGVAALVAPGKLGSYAFDGSVSIGADGRLESLDIRSLHGDDFGLMAAFPEAWKDDIDKASEGKAYAKKLSRFIRANGLLLEISGDKVRLDPRNSCLSD